MIGISEGMVLAERYRLVRRHEDLGTGEFWGGVDQETGSEVWVCFSDRPGLGRISEQMREWRAAATPRMLDSGEVRLILDSRTLGAAGATGRAATHVEVVVEFAVQAPALGKPLSGRFARRPLAPGEALTLVGLLAAALEEALEAGYSHGRLSAASAWNLRRRVCLVDLAAGLAAPDAEKVEIAEQVSGYYAAERVAGGAASEAADVFALGWLLYASLVGQANLDGYYREAVAAAGSASTAELLALWRERSREHVRALPSVDAALVALLLGALAERPADRPTLAEFRTAASEAARALAGAAAMVAYQPKKRPSTAAVAAGAGAEIAAVAAGAGAEIAAVAMTEVMAEAAAAETGLAAEATAEVTAAEAGLAAAETVAAVGDAAESDLVAGGAVETVAAVEESPEASGVGSLGAAEVIELAAGALAIGGLTEAEEAPGSAPWEASGETSGSTGAAGAVGAASGGVGAAAVASEMDVVNVAAAGSEMDVVNVAAAGSGSDVVNVAAAGGGSDVVNATAAGSGSDVVNATAAGSGSDLVNVAAAGGVAAAGRRRRPRLGAGLLAACAIALLAIGMGSGYAFASSGSRTAVSSMASGRSNANVGTVSAAVAGAACAPSAGPTSSAAPARSSAAAASAPSAAAAWDENAALPLPTSSAAAVAQLTQIVQGAQSSGLISSGTAEALRGQIADVQRALASGTGYAGAWRRLSQSIASGRNQGTIPQALSVQLDSSLAYLYVSTGS